MEKRVTVYLDTGTIKEHVLVVIDDADYVKKINECKTSLMGNQRGILGFTTPFCIYKVQNIAAIEFSDPPPDTDKLPIGFKPQKEQDF